LTSEAPRDEAAQRPGSVLQRVLGGELKDALVFTGTNLLRNLGGFLLVPLYWRRLQPADYGILAVIGIVGAFQALLGSLAIELAVTRFYYVWPEAERADNLGALWVWNWMATVCSGALFLLAMPHLSPLLFPQVPYQPYLPLGIASNILSGLFTVPASTIRIRRLPWLFATYNLTSFTLSTGLGIWFVVVRDEKLVGFLHSSLCANGAMAVFGAAVMLACARPRLWSPGLWPALRFCLPSLPSNLLTTCSSVFDRALLNYFASLHTLGLYALCQRFAELITGALHASLKMAYTPFMLKHLKHDDPQGKAIVTSVTSFYLLPYFIAALGLVYFIRPFVLLIGRADYYPIVEWVPWFAGIAVLTCLLFYYTNGMFLANRTELMTIPALCQLTLLLGSCAVLIPRFQLPGLIASQYVTAGGYFAVSLYFSERVYPLPHRFAQLIAMAAGALVFGALGILIRLSNPYLEVALKLPLLGAYAALGYLYLKRQPLRTLTHDRDAAV